MRTIVMWTASAAERATFRLKKELREFQQDEEGVGVIEVVLILVVLIGLVAVFKTQINQLLNGIFSAINEAAEDIY